MNSREASILHSSYQTTGTAHIRRSTSAANPSPLLIAIHGYAQAPEPWIEYASSLVNEGVSVLVPLGPSSFYVRSKSGDGTNKRGVAYGWVAHRERHITDARNAAFIESCVHDAMAQIPIDRQRIVFLGYSQGVGVAMHAARHLPWKPAGFIGLAGGVPKGDREPCKALAPMPTLWIGGTKDSSYPSEYMQDVVNDLDEAGLSTFHHALDAGHDLLDEAVPHVRAWLARLLPDLV